VCPTYVLQALSIYVVAGFAISEFVVQTNFTGYEAHILTKGRYMNIVCSHTKPDWLFALEHDQRAYCARTNKLLAC
jgi:hypothetical protein